MSDIKVLSALNRTSRYFRAVTDSALYGSLRIGLASSACRSTRQPMNERMQTVLYRTLQATRYAEIVTEFRIDFSWCGARRLPPLKRLRRIRCTCSRLDQLLGQALCSFENLRILRFSCYCCNDPTDSRHLYLQHLKAKQLRELTFDCQCMPPESSKLFLICTAPCMRNLTGIEWPKTRNSAPEPSIRALIEDKECLPQLKGLYFHRNIEAVAPLIEKGTLKYLRCSVLNDRIQELVDKHPGALKTLRVKRRKHTIPTLIAQNPNTYRNLVRLGQLYCSDKEVLAYLLPLACLLELKILDVLDEHNPDGALDPWKNEQNNGLVPRIGAQHPTLRKIYLEILNTPSAKSGGNGYYIWLEGDNCWRLQQIHGIKQWREMDHWSWKLA